MYAKIKAEWVAELRSGKYKQGRCVLRSSDNKFCCLGVLCNIHAKHHPEFASKQNNVVQDECLSGDYNFEYGGEEQLPPEEVYKWAGLSGDASVKLEGTFDTLYNHNDSGVSFKKIATAIEKQL
jgi:hypothetical protein